MGSLYPSLPPSHLPRPPPPRDGPSSSTAHLSKPPSSHSRTLSTPHCSSEAMPTPSVCSIPVVTKALPLTAAAVEGNLKDLIYQRSHALRKELQKGKVPTGAFLQRMEQLFKLDEAEMCHLEAMLDRTGVSDERGLMSFTDFVERLKAEDKTLNPQQEGKEKLRFGVHGVMDRRMQKVLLNNPGANVAMSNRRPANELGPMTIEAPFGVLGDGERMSALISSYLDLKWDTLRNALTACDSDKDGRLTHDEFRAAMRKVDPYIFESEIDALIPQLDKRKRGFIDLNAFVEGVGQEYLKKKADRGSQSLVGGDPLRWEAQESGKGAPQKPRAPPSRHTRRVPFTRSARLRKQDNMRRIHKNAMLEQQALGQLPAGAGRL